VGVEVVERAAGTGYRIATAGHLVLMVFDTDPDLASLDALDVLQTELTRTLGRFVHIAVVQTEKLSPPPAEYRQKAAEIEKRHEDALIASAIVIRTKGVAAVVTRAFLAAFALLSRQKKPMRTFRELEPAVQWMQSMSADVLALGPGLIEALDAYATGDRRR
jgi:hypothetical protein